MLVDLETAHEARQPLSVVRGETPMSGAWTWHDRVLWAAYREYRRRLCEGCGGYLPETTDAKRWSGPGRTHRHEVHQVLKCWECAHRNDEASALQKNEKHPHLLRIILRAVGINSGGDTLAGGDGERAGAGVLGDDFPVDGNPAGD